MRRRTALSSIGAGVGVLLAGCLGSGSTDSGIDRDEYDVVEDIVHDGWRIFISDAMFPQTARVFDEEGDDIIHLEPDREAFASIAIGQERLSDDVDDPIKWRW